MFSKLPKDRVRHTLSAYELEQMIGEIEEDLDDDDPEFSAVIFDDMASYYKLKDI